MTANLDTVTRQAESRLLEFTRSELFNRTFREGMDIVEETAAYLDGPGRANSKSLNRSDALVYASHSMRLTTKLMQVASWLLVQRAVKEQEMTVQEAWADKYRIVEDPKDSDKLSFDNLAKVAQALPSNLLELIARGDQLYERVARLDRSLYRTVEAQKGNSVADQLQRLRSAFK
ncbi:MAG: DUF1465 family protein [Hellea sp.]|nr:DUF1465 family protein [Hellea sp.]